MSNIPNPPPPPGANDLWVCVNPNCNQAGIPKYAVDTGRNPPSLTDVKCGHCWESCERRPLPVQQQP